MIKIADCGLQIADFILRLAKSFQDFSEIPVPKSKIEKGRLNVIGKV
jgi:hypothetical protein